MNIIVYLCVCVKMFMLMYIYVQLHVCTYKDIYTSSYLYFLDIYTCTYPHKKFGRHMEFDAGAVESIHAGAQA